MPRRMQLTDLQDTLRGGHDGAWCNRSSSLMPSNSASAGSAPRPKTAELQRAEALLEGLGEGPADRHRLADRLHLGAKHGIGPRELLERPARDLGDHVVDDWLEAGRASSW